MCSIGKTYSYNFISEPENCLLCSICLDLASHPKQCEDCGKLFCSECIEKNGRRPCANCRTNKPRYFRDVRSKEIFLCIALPMYLLSGRREINALQVRCANSERGCQWTGTVGTLDNHIASCQFALVPCPNKCEEDKGAEELLLLRKHLDQHLKTKCPKRAYECPHCGEKGTFASITEDHDQVCDKKMVACPNKGSGCSLSMERGKTKEHVSSDCEYTEVACVYESLGCGVRMLRKYIIEHQDNGDKVHLHLVLKTVVARDEQLIKLSDKVSLQEELLKTLSEGGTVVFQLPGYASKNEKNERFCSTPFYTHPGGYKMCSNIDANGCGEGEGTHVSVYTKILEGRYDNQLHWPFLGTVTYELLNQLGDDNHHRTDSTYDTSDNMRVGSSKGYHKFVPHSSLSHNPATNTQYLLDDTLYFRVSVKLDNHKSWLVCTDKVPIRATNNYKTLKNNEPMIFKVTNFKVWKVSQVSISSSSFYTSSCGYKMCVRIDANGDGDGEGTHVSIFTKLLEGCYDNQLHWPFLGTVIVKLLNQLGDYNHHQRNITYGVADNMRVGSSRGYHKFVPHSSLGHNPATNTQYLLDDTLYFRVSVKVDNHKPWLVCTQ